MMGERPALLLSLAASLLYGSQYVAIKEGIGGASPFLFGALTMGDSLKVWYYNDNGTVRLRMIFEYCEGEHYYKYAGWKRVFGQFVLYDAALSDIDINEIHDKMAIVVKSWFESHLRHNREVLINTLKDNFEKGETFTE